MSKLKKNKITPKKSKFLTNKIIIISLAILLVIVILVSLSGFFNKDVNNDINNNESSLTNTNLNNNTESKISEVITENKKEIEKLEIIHFHGNNQCQSCVLVGDYAEDTINTYFSEELKSGKITFMHINGEHEENYNLVKKYNATGSSLFIGTYYKNGEFEAEQNINVWYKISNKEEYLKYLKNFIQEILS